MPDISKIVSAGSSYPFYIDKGSVDFDSYYRYVYENLYAWRFDGVNERFQFTAPAGSAAVNPFALSVWIRTTSAGSIESVVCKDYTGGSDRDWNLYWRGSGSGLRQLFFTKWDVSGTAFSIASAPNILDDGQWHYIQIFLPGTAAVNGSTMFVDNVLSGSGTDLVPGIRNNVPQMGIGGLAFAAGWNFNGDIKDVAVWSDTDQSANQVAMWNGGVPLDLAAYNPSYYFRPEQGVWDGGSSIWTMNDLMGNAGNAVSSNMELADRIAFP